MGCVRGHVESAEDSGRNGKHGRQPPPPAGGTYRAVSLRTIDPATAHWSIWWLDGRSPDRLDVPVVGGFADGIGLFIADDVLNGTPIRVRFRWSIPDDGNPLWEQTFSADAGTTWETNWTMVFRRMAGID